MSAGGVARAMSDGELLRTGGSCEEHERQQGDERAVWTSAVHERSIRRKLRSRCLLVP
jgi:hypothetical protein